MGEQPSRACEDELGAPPPASNDAVRRRMQAVRRRDSSE